MSCFPSTMTSAEIETYQLLSFIKKVKMTGFKVKLYSVLQLN